MGRSGPKVTTLLVERTASTPISRMDSITPERRSALMARIRGRNTAPELAVRRLAHALGCRFRLPVPAAPARHA